MRVRVACAQVITTILREHRSLTQVLPVYAAQVPEQDRNLLQELCFGTLRWYPRYQAILQQLLEKPLKSKDRDIAALLASALYQLDETRVPAHAAVHETVAACKALNKNWARGLINAVLRRYLREKATLQSQLAENPDYQLAHPSWLAKTFQQAWPEQWQDILKANNSRPPMTLRVNRRKVSREEYLKLLHEAGFSTQNAERKTQSASEADVHLTKPAPVDQLPGFAKGLVSVQDQAAQLSAELLDPAPGQRVLDACCAPGGKTCHILEHQPALDELLALDIDANRLQRVQENLQRLELNARLLAADATHPESWWDGKPFDRILLDAPCSATGVIRRHPDIKLLRKPADIAKLVATQHRLLKSLWPLLKPGGKLLYATCSLLPQENEQVVAAFTHTQRDCRVVDIAASWGIATGCGRQLLPQVGGNDGFYYALLEKRADAEVRPSYSIQAETDN